MKPVIEKGALLLPTVLGVTSAYIGYKQLQEQKMSNDLQREQLALSKQTTNNTPSSNSNTTTSNVNPNMISSPLEAGDTSYIDNYFEIVGMCIFINNVLLVLFLLVLFIKHKYLTSNYITNLHIVKIWIKFTTFSIIINVILLIFGNMLIGLALVLSRLLL